MGVFRRQTWERDMSREIESHLQMHTDDNLRAGMDPREARRADGCDAGREHDPP